MGESSTDYSEQSLIIVPNANTPITPMWLIS